MAPKKTTKRPVKKQYKASAKKTSKYKSDTIDKICTTFVSPTGIMPDDDMGNGGLCPPADVIAGAEFTVQATIALDARNALLANPSHASYINLFNEWNCSGIALDLLFSPTLRENADQVFMLVERGNKDAISNENAMCSDINHRMYQLGNNTQKLSFQHSLTTSQDKINKKSTSVASGVSPNDLSYLKILCVGKNNTSATIDFKDLQIKLRAKMFNKYHDMKVLSAGLAPPLN